jgi:ureidoglycolate lyase
MPERTLPVDDLTDEAFAPFGAVVGEPARTHDATGPGWRWWGETSVLEDDGRPWTIGYLDIEPSPPPRFDWAERHLRSQEAIVPVSGGCLVYVAPPDHPEDANRLPPFEAFRVFRVPPGRGVVMHPAVWHGAPIADDGPAKAIVLLLAGTGRDDVTLVRFDEAPIHIERG